ncbi:50S ribosomal protein L31 [Candidatus Peribacteria bacterium]|nr:50S ribosomal protein L31 [Candidatus Peribacteria bacterium]
MKAAIHPEMFADAKTSCSTCKAVYLIPSTVKEQTVEVCRACHPIYTGKKQTEARGGRVERFRKIQAASKGKTATKK